MKFELTPKERNNQNDLCLHELFEQQVRQTPQATAVVFEHTALTYQELNQKANELAFRLQQRGVGTEILVGLCVERSLEMIVGLLGILKAGGAFVPLDPTYPQERLAFMIADSRVPLVLTATAWSKNLPLDPTQILELAEMAPAGASKTDLVRTVKPHHLACCLYTSGSTGQPKGVLIEHHSLTTNCYRAQTCYQMDVKDRVLLFASLNYIAALEQIFTPLTMGATLVLREAKLWNALEFPEKLRYYGITVVDLPPNYWQVLLEGSLTTPTKFKDTTLRLIIVGGEALLPKVVELWQQAPLKPVAHFLNTYGMTEAPILVTKYEVGPTVESRIPIGQPVGNWKIHLLDEHLQPVGEGVAGELHIGGASLARGYLNQPELTQTRFLPDPFSATAGARLYKTGDLARWLPDGNLEYLGRLDHQVSLRGFRMELGEIEGVLTQHLAVQDAAVITQGTGTAQRLVAYVVPREKEWTHQLQDFWTVQGTYSQEPGILTEPTERLTFKLKQHNLPSSAGSGIPLFKPELDNTVIQAYLKRQSYRQFDQTLISFRQLSHFLSCLSQLTLPQFPIPKYRYPSALGLYPVQTYLYLKPNRVADLEGGFYSYHPGEHSLRRLAAPTLTEEVYGGYNQAIAIQAAFTLFLVAHEDAIIPLYGATLARKFSFFEAGYMGQLLMTEAPNYELGLCPLGDLEEFGTGKEVHQQLGLSTSQVIVHSFLGGAIAPAQTQQWLQPVASQKSPAQLKTELHAYLTAKLPGQMVPDSWMLLEKMPLTPNGKINRQALPAPTDSHIGLVLPRTPLEEMIADLWREVLKLQQVSVEDNFFEVGGNSLTALQLLTKIRQTFQVELSLQTLLNDGQTVATLAALLATRQPTQTVLPVVAATASRHSPLSADEPLVLSFAQQWFWFLSQFDSQTAAHNMFAAWQLEGSLHLEACRQALLTLVDRQESLRLYFPEANSTGKVQRLPVYDPLTVTDLSEGPAATSAVPLEDLIQEYAQQPFDLSKGPLLRLQLLKLDTRKHLLLLSMHHIIGDAWSLGIFEREWRLLYTAYSQNQTPPLPPLPIQYTDYAAWQHHYLSAEAFQSQLSYWLAQLNEAPELLNLPTDYPRPDQQANQGGLVAWKISTDLINQLQQLARQHNSTLSMVLFTTFNLLLYRYSGQRDLCVGVPMATRHLRHTEDLIGIFLNMLVLRSRFPQEGTFLDLLTQIKQRMLEAYARPDVPFEYLVRHLKPSRQTSYNPYFQVMFNFVNLPVRPVQELPGLQVTPLHQRFTEMPISNLDLVFTLWETPDGLNGQLLFDKALFREDTIQYLATGFTQLLEQAVRQPETLLRQFTLSEAAMGYYPLTSSQREIWFDQLLHEGVPLYNIGGYVRIDGAIDPQRFEQAVNFLVQKHDTLRTRLSKERDDDGLPLQTYVPTVSVTVPLHDFTGDTAPHEAALAWMQQRFVQPFELYGSPLYRYDLLKVNEDCYYWLMQYHHLIIDGWGIALVTRSLAEIYNQLTAGQSPALSGYSYRDYIENDRTYIDSPSYEKQRQYWLAKYPSPPAPLLSPRYRPAATTHLLGSECHVWYLPRTFYNRLNDLARDQNATLFQLLLGVVYVYFTRTTQREDLVIGLPILNRAQAVLKQTAGLFTGVSAARFEFGTDLTFAQLLSKINQTLKSDYRHQRFPISELQRKIGLPQGRARLFDVSLSYESHDYDARFNEGDGQFTPMLHPWEQTPLLIFVRDFHTQAAVKLDLVYNLAYFQTAEVVALQTRLEQILQYVLEHPDTMVNRIPLLTAPEQAQLLAWNQTQTDYPKDQTIVNLFQAQVAKTPENIAVVFDDQHLTYQELNAKANQLAHYLMSLGVTAETLVGICVERSLEMVIGLLGILKAGGAYVPLDPAYPQERLRFMLEDSQVPVLLTQRHLQDRLPVSTATVVLLDSHWERLATSSPANPERQSGPANLAYVLFTSGSTGKAKGVMIEHHSTSTLVYWAHDTFTASELTSVLASTSINFDLSVYEMFVPLCQGGKLVVVENALCLPTLAPTSGITLINTVPSAMTELWRRQGIPESVQVVNLAGEPLRNDLVQALYQQETLRRVYNLYGPSEDTTYSTYSLVVKGSGSEPTIGRPLANTQIYILDTNHQPTPPGIPGELCLAGAGLARGYLNRPDLTAERFLEVELFGQRTRVYKTGDLARWLPDGNLEYLGRLDHQIKLRGFRIELGEIEATLTQHEAVKEAVVVLREQDTNPNLAAYVTLITSTPTVLSDLSGFPAGLRAWLKTRLPDYMIPASFTVLEKLPLTPNGKIDRQALPSPEETVVPRTEANLLPQTAAERTIATIWQQVLRVTNVGIHSNFFDLGGHSLLLLRVQAQLQDQFAQPIALPDLFEYPTIHLLAQHLTKTSEAGMVSPDTQADRRRRQETMRPQRRALRQQHRSNS